MVNSRTIDEIDETKELEDLKILEAVFFVSGRFLNMQELISLSDLNPIIIESLIGKLREKYEKENSALEIVEIPKGVPQGGASSSSSLRGISGEMSTRGKDVMWKMDVKKEYSHIINKLATGSAEFSKAEQETLAIIAFKQPIKQSVIIKIRGNKAYDHVKKFADLNLIKKKKIGHTNELSLSDEFYDYFNVADGNPFEEIKGDEQGSSVIRQNVAEQKEEE